MKEMIVGTICLLITFVVIVLIAWHTWPKIEPTEDEVLQSIRANFLYFGYDLRNYSDQEIKDGLIQSGSIIAKYGITTEQAVNALRLLSKQECDSVSNQAKIQLKKMKELRSMKIFIFENIKQCSSMYHPEGGLVIIAKNKKHVKELIRNYNYIEITENEWKTVKSFNLADENVKPKLWVMPDSGGY